MVQYVHCVLLFWPKILFEHISAVCNEPESLNPSKLLQLGPSLLNNISKKISNKFWQQVLVSALKISEGAIFSNPEKIGSSSFWHNPLIRRNNKVVTYLNFPEISDHISTSSDFFYPCSNQIMTWNDFCDEFNVVISENSYIGIRYIISLALQN